MYYYDVPTASCKIFNYGGCGGNKNKFDSPQECMDACSVKGREKGVPEAGCNQCELQAQQTDTCPTRGSRWAYNSRRDLCEPFTGCPGLVNNFDTELACADKCIKDICLSNKAEGTCKEANKRWFYSPDDYDCREFIFTGCHGNKNQFETKEKCLAKCADH